MVNAALSLYDRRGEEKIKMANKRMVITECNGRQIYKSDFTFAESITLLEIWKSKLIQEKIAAQDIVESDLQQHTTGNCVKLPVEQRAKDFIFK